MSRSKNKNRLSLRFIIVMMVAAWIVASFILHLPPASWIQSRPEQPPLGMEEEPATTFPEKAPFRFGSRALAGICDEYGLDKETIVMELEAFAIEAKPEWSIKRIAEENDMEPEALFEVIREISIERDQPPLDVLD